MLSASAAINYLHTKTVPIFHNNLKEDNIIVEVSCGATKSVIIDFGKACYENEAKMYSLTASDREAYKKNHPHIAPDL